MGAKNDACATFLPPLRIHCVYIYIYTRLNMCEGSTVSVAVKNRGFTMRGIRKSVPGSGQLSPT